MPSRTIVWLLAFSLTFPRLLADPPRPSSAPDLGPDKYTIHTSGTLHDIVEALSKLTHRQIWINRGIGRGVPPAPTPNGLEDTPVSLNFDNATLDTILLSLCTQAGLVYEVQQGYYGLQSPPLALRPGDPTVDSRPTCVLDDYTLRVLRVVNTRSRETDFRWGTTQPDRPDEAANLQVTVEVTPHSPDAALRLAGLGQEARGIPDVGAPVTLGSDRNRFYQSMIQHDPLGGGSFQPLTLGLPLPGPEATVLKRLEGSLALFSEVKVTELRIPPGSEGQTFTKDDVTATVRAWKMEGDTLRVEVDATCPSLPREPNQPWYQDGWQTVALVGKDGRHAMPQSSSWGGGPQVKLAFTFSLTSRQGPPDVAGEPPIEPEAFVATFYRTGPPNKTVPFVFENIPLP